MYWVYILFSPSANRFYIGFTYDLKRRLTEHNNGLSLSTTYGKPWKLVYCEGFRSKLDAIDREKRLKHHAKGIQMLKARLKNSIEIVKR